MTGLVTIYSTFPNEEEAARITRLLVEERLAACANILGPCRSIYRWQGKIEDGGEVAALFKTKQGLAERLIARLAELHSYDVPAAVAWPIVAGFPAYLAWIDEETNQR